jgi:hypothetical protein
MDSDMTYTPETLRTSCRQVRARPQALRLNPDIVEDHADAWQVDLSNADTRITSLMADRDVWQARETELLEALKAVMAEWRDGYGLNCVDQVCAAIAKVTRE